MTVIAIWSFFASKAKIQKAGKFPLMIKHSQILALLEICFNSVPCSIQPCSLFHFLGHKHAMPLASLIGKEKSIHNVDLKISKSRYFTVQRTCFAISLYLKLYLNWGTFASILFFSLLFKKDIQVVLFRYHPPIFSYSLNTITVILSYYSLYKNTYIGFQFILSYTLVKNKDNV